MSQEEQNKALFYRWFNEAWNSGEFAVAREIISPKMQVHGAGGVRHLVLEVLAHADEEAAAIGRVGRAVDEARAPARGPVGAPPRRRSAPAAHDVAPGPRRPVAAAGRPDRRLPAPLGTVRSR